MAVPLIEARNILKRFGDLVANEVESFDVRTGEVHALLGENGAGKTTLSKILYGFYRPDAGEIRVAGTNVSFASPADARAAGIGMVFQEFSLVPALSVLDNVALFMPDLPRVPDRRALRVRIATAAKALGLELPLDAPVAALPVAAQQKVEILKQVLAGMRVILLDEPTKVLAPQECSGLFATVASLRAAGYGIVLITHKLHEALAAADRISVMRKGRMTATLAARAATREALLAVMFEGSPPQSAAAPAAQAIGAPLLQLDRVSTSGGAHATPLQGIDLGLREGEILGVAGIAGSGQRELGALVAGHERPRRGRKLFRGGDASRWTAGRMRRAGVGFVPENPLEAACVGELSVAENFALGERRYASGLGFNWTRVHDDAEAAFARLGVARPSLNAPVRTLSGGNVQRVVMARELGRAPRLVVAIYPTRGLDARSAQAVRDALRARASEGAAVLLMSEELEELFELADRVVVLRSGMLAGEFSRGSYSIEAVGAAMVQSDARTALA
ncbi:MAG: ATP-binding cassette domain-containing protein [Betaproteobacteria bacterium]|nr:ATP-binding cassette domain-containing protein [Betaproteobacteria bacterium]